MDSIAERQGSGIVGKPSDKTVPLRAPFANSYTIDGHQGHASELSHSGPCDVDRLVKALEKRFAKLTPPSSQASECAGDETNDNIDDNAQTAQAMKLEYKRVDEMYA